MKSLPNEAKVVVIGGGVAGCSTAYHLAKNGWTTKQILSHYYPKTKYGFLP